MKHRTTQIQGEIVQIEESLAMPHVWVIEPSVCEVNPPRLYRLVDLEKVSSFGDKQRVSEELLEDIFDATACDQFNISSSNSSTLNKCDADRLSKRNNVLLEDKKEVLSLSEPQKDKQTVTAELLEDISEVTVCDRLSISKRNSSTLNKSSGDRLLASNPVLLEDNREVPSLRNDLTSNQLLDDKTEVPPNSNDLTSNQLLANELPHTVSKLTPQRRMKGDGSGCIYWRTVVRNGKEYQLSLIHI